MSNNFRLNAKKPRNNAGVATPKCEMFLLYREDIVSIPPAGARGILTEGDIKIKSGRRFHILYTTPTTQVHSRDTEGEVDSRGWKKKITGHHPGDELEINEFVKNNVNQGFVIVVKSCQSEYMKIYGSVNNPMYFTGSFVDDSEKKGYELTFEQNFADEDPILFYQGNIIVDEDALAEIDPEFSSFFVKLDASNIDEESKNLLKKKLDIGELPKNVATVDEGKGEDKKEGNTYTKDQVDDLLDEKLATPTEEGTTDTHPYVVGVDAEGNSVKLPAGDLGKNSANSDLETTDNRTFTQKHIYTHATGGFPYRITGLADKSVDTAFSGILVRNANGDLAWSNGKAVLENLMSILPSVKNEITGNYDMSHNTYLVYDPITKSLKVSDRPQIVSNFNVPQNLNITLNPNIQNVQFTPKPQYSQNIIDALEFLKSIETLEYVKFRSDEMKFYHIQDEDLPDAIRNDTVRKQRIQDLLVSYANGAIYYKSTDGSEYNELYGSTYVNKMVSLGRKSIVTAVFDKAFPEDKDWCISFETFGINGSNANAKIAFSADVISKNDYHSNQSRLMFSIYNDRYYTYNADGTHFLMKTRVNSVFWFIKKGDTFITLVQTLDDGMYYISIRGYDNNLKYMYMYFPLIREFVGIEQSAFSLINCRYWIQP